MRRRFILLGIILLAVSLSFTGCIMGKNQEKQDINQDINQGINQDSNEKVKDSDSPQNGRVSLAGISLGDSKDTVEKIRGQDYEVESFEEAGHFPEEFYSMIYADGTVFYIGQKTEKVLEISTTAPGAATNLGIKVGDSAEKVFAVYRAKYTEPESIHGYGKLEGVFKVEEGACIIFDFNVEDGIVNPETVALTDTLERIILTYPANIDEDF